MDKKTTAITIKLSDAQKEAYDADANLAKGVRQTVAAILDARALPSEQRPPFELIPDYTVIDFSATLRNAETLSLVLTDPVRFLVMHDHRHALGERIAYNRPTHLFMPDAGSRDYSRAFDGLDQAITAAIHNAPFGTKLNRTPPHYRQLTPVGSPFNSAPPFALITEDTLTLGLPSVTWAPSHPALKVSAAHPTYQTYRAAFDVLRDNLPLEGITFEFLP